MSEDEVKNKKRDLFVAERLDVLAGMYIDAANGQIRLGSEEAKQMGNLARSVVRLLVEDIV